MCTYDTYATWGPGDRDLIFYNYADGTAVLHHITLNGHHRRRLTNDHVHQWFPNWSPSGRRLLFVSDGGIKKHFSGSDLYVGNVDKEMISEVRHLTFNDAMIMHTEWTPDESAIVYSSSRERGAPHEIWKYTFADNALRSLTEDSASDDRFPSYSPDGNSIVYVSDRDEAPDIYRMDADGEHVRMY